MKTITIKSVEDTRYMVKLLQSEHSGLYYLEHGKTADEAPTMSEGIKDYKTASYAFDVTLLEYQGQ